jgi:hypothetical protein
MGFMKTCFIQMKSEDKKNLPAVLNQMRAY